jgi:hypothetical protein
MSTLTISSPGVQINEVDLSIIARPLGATDVLVTGFAPQGPTEELTNIGSVSEYESVFGTPTNAAERYLYYKARQILSQSPANLMVSRLPYGSGLGDGYTNSYSALVYPLSCDALTYSDATAFKLMPPVSVLLNEDQYNAVLNQEATIMLARWAAVLAGGSVFYAFTGGPFSRMLFKNIPGFNTLLLGGAAAVKTWINDKENANYIASLIADNIPELAQTIGTVINSGLQHVPKILRPAIPGADNPNSEYNQQRNQAASPNGTSQNTGSSDIDKTSDAGTIDPVTGKTPSGRKMYYKTPSSSNTDITGWIEDPGNPRFIMDPNNPAARLGKPTGWRPD